MAPRVGKRRKDSVHHQVLGAPVRAQLCSKCFLWLLIAFEWAVLVALQLEVLQDLSLPGQLKSLFLLVLPEVVLLKWGHDIFADYVLVQQIVLI